MQYHSVLSGHCRRVGPAGIADGQQTGPPAADPCKIASPATALWAASLIGVKFARVRREHRAGEQQGGLGDRRAGPRQGARRATSNGKRHGGEHPARTALTAARLDRLRPKTRRPCSSPR